MENKDKMCRRHERNCIWPDCDCEIIDSDPSPQSAIYLKENKDKEAIIKYTDAEDCYTYFRIKEMLPSHDAVGKRQICEAMESYSASQNEEIRNENKEIKNRFEKSFNLAEIRRKEIDKLIIEQGQLQSIINELKKEKKS